MMSKKRTIALIVPGLLHGGGGVPAVARFLYEVINSSGRYEGTLISLATSWQDPNSVRLMAPRTWCQDPRITLGTWEGNPYQHIGAFLPELEFQRYQPRKILTNLLNQFDLIQVVAGTPSWACATNHVTKPVCLFTATTVRNERVSLIRHTTGWRQLYLTLMTTINAHMECGILTHMACVFPESNYTAKVLSSFVAKDRLVLGPPGVNIDHFKPSESRMDDYILSVGRFADPRKNIALLFQAYHRLCQLYPESPRLILAGKIPPATQDLEIARSLGIVERIEIRNNVSQAELIMLYQNAALFVLSSDEEGLGIVILEAMACATPVVATDCGGPGTVVEDGITGYLTPTGAIEPLAQSMHRMLAHPALRRQMGQAGRAHIEQRYSTEAAGRIYLDKYDELLK